MAWYSSSAPTSVSLRSSISHFVAQVRDTHALNNRERTLQGVTLARCEERRAAAEHHRRQVEPDLVDQARVDGLPRDLAAVEPDRLLPGVFLRHRDGFLDAAADEREVLGVLQRPMGEHDG